MSKVEIKYLIHKQEDSELYTLFSRVPTGFGGPADNFICEGTLTYCVDIREQLRTKTAEHDEETTKLIEDRMFGNGGW